MVDEEFTEDDFEEDDAPKPQVQKIVKPSNPPAVAPAKKQAQQPAATRDAAAPTEKFTPYSLPPRVGIYDNELGRPILEDTDASSIILGLLTKIANDVDEIKGRL
jgi:hypothetical protein